VASPLILSSPKECSNQMNVTQLVWTRTAGLQPEQPQPDNQAQLALLFGSRASLQDPDSIESIRRQFPSATLLGCSTAGEIRDSRLYDDTVNVTAVRFDATRIAGASVPIATPEGSYEAGAALARRLAAGDLVHLFVLSDGLNVNGSELVKGLSESLPAGVTLSGGLSGDGTTFGETTVVFGETVSSRMVAAVGFYGDRLEIGCASLGGWDSFGAERLVTRSEANVLYELDGFSALDLYKRYLGDHARDLPGSGLLFPLSIRNPEDDSSVVRTILAVDEKAQSLTFAGDVPEGWYARLMKANFDRLIDGAIGAARASLVSVSGQQPDLAILISCVGRRMVLRQRTEEELEGVRDVVGAKAALTGFYSYGEISPFTPDAKCALHNQTMTITSFREI
jgi:hypothetical protein